MLASFLNGLHIHTHTHTHTHTMGMLCLNGYQVLITGCKALDKQTEGILDEDGLPQVGAKLKEGDPFYRLVGRERACCNLWGWRSLLLLSPPATLIRNRAGVQ